MEFCLTVVLLFLAVIATTLANGWWIAAPLLTLTGGIVFNEEW